MLEEDFKINSLNGTTSKPLFDDPQKVLSLGNISLNMNDIFQLVKVIQIDHENQINTDGEIVENSLLKYNNDLLKERCVIFSNGRISAHGGKYRKGKKSMKLRKRKSMKFRKRKGKKSTKLRKRSIRKK